METERTELAELEVMVRETTDVAITDEVKMALARDLLPVAERMHGYTAFAAIVNITDKESADRASGVVAEIDRDLKLVKGHDVLSGITSGLDKLHKRAVAFRSLFTGPMERDKKAIRQPVLDWEAAEKAKAAALAAKLQAAADEKARKERERQEAEAAKQRAIEEVARKVAEDARRKAEKAKGDERARLDAEANAADRKASAAAVKVETRTEAAASVIAPTIHIDAPKSGMRSQGMVTCEIVSIVEFVKAATARPDLCGYIDQKALAAALKKTRISNSMFEVPGVKFGRKTV